MAYKPETLETFKARVTGEALLRLGRGELWTDIVSGIIVSSIRWVDVDRVILNRKAKD